MRSNLKTLCHLILQIFKEKAIHIADRLMPAFNTPTGIPYALVNLKRLVSSVHSPVIQCDYIDTPYTCLHRHTIDTVIHEYIDTP